MSGGSNPNSSYSTLMKKHFPIPFFMMAVALLWLHLTGCVPDSGPPAGELTYVALEGETMGTYYRVQYADPEGRDYQASVDSLLRAFNLQVSTYIDSSTISRFNRAAEVFPLSPADSHFLANYEAASVIYRQSKGAFDPTVMPLVNYWGFGYTEKKPVTAVDSLRIDSLMQFVGMDKITLEREGASVRLRKALPGVQLDFSAIAKGSGVDLVGRLLEARGIRHYLVDIGGELVARGRSPRGDAWKVGINVPREDAGFSELQTAMPLTDQAVATSGNYRNFYEVNGVKYSHTINPRTGFPERNRLLSASIVAGDCMRADAYATASMVMGIEEAFDFIAALPDVEGYFIYSDAAGLMQVRHTEGLDAIFGAE